jgi:hypothetical protein
MVPTEGEAIKVHWVSDDGTVVSSANADLRFCCFPGWCKQVHLTGGIHTHDALVWGSTPEIQEANKRNKSPVLKAQMFSELGAITPYIVMPSADVCSQGDGARS